MRNKVAEISLLFWAMKIVATTLGETLGDFFSMTLNLGYTLGILITFSFFLVLLLVQLSRTKYIPVIFWLVIIGTTTLGTEISDYLDRSLELGYTAGTLVLAGGLLITLYLWLKKYGDVKVSPIFDKQKEFYYWAAVLFSNSLGTAFGDFLGDSLGLSYFYGALASAAVIVAVIVLYYFTRISHNILFWIAFIFTRPFGATFGDLLTKPVEKGGLQLGTLQSSLVSVGVMMIFLFFEYRNGKKRHVIE